MSEAPLRLALVGGGTGGHVVPGLHLLAHARKRSLETETLWFGAGRQIENRVFAGAGTPDRGAPTAESTLTRVALSLEPPGGGAPSRLRLALSLGPAVRQARKELRKHRISVCLGLGGYTVVPVVLAARSLGIPVLLLEVNAEPGLATRWLSRFAHVVAHAWPSSVPTTGRANHVVLGPPLAPRFFTELPDAARKSFLRRALGFDPERPLLLVLGGSQGALGLNRFCRDNASAFTDRGVQVLHQVGPKRKEEGAAEAGGYRPVEFIDDVCLALDASDVVLCRGGASTLAEVAARGVPAFVVPYPHHPDDHQEKNARVFGDGLRILPEAELGEEALREILALVLPEGADERRRRSRSLSAHAPRDGANRLLDLILDQVEEV